MVGSAVEILIHLIPSVMEISIPGWSAQSLLAVAVGAAESRGHQAAWRRPVAVIGPIAAVPSPFPAAVLHLVSPSSLIPPGWAAPPAVPVLVHERRGSPANAAAALLLLRRWLSLLHRRRPPLFLSAAVIPLAA